MVTAYIIPGTDYGFVVMDSAKAVESALSGQPPFMLGGRPLAVKPATSREAVRAVAFMLPHAVEMLALRSWKVSRLWCLRCRDSPPSCWAAGPSPSSQQRAGRRYVLLRPCSCVLWESWLCGHEKCRACGVCAVGTAPLHAGRQAPCHQAHDEP